VIQGNPGYEVVGDRTTHGLRKDLPVSAIPIHRRHLRAATVAAVAAAAAAAVFVPAIGSASSHREAPAISEDPTADNTDLYFFRSPDNPDTATIIGNWIPLEEPSAGPNYYLFSQSARYNLSFDKTGDGKWDTRYQFQFRTLDAKADAAGYLYVGPDNKPIINQLYDVWETTRNAAGKVATKRIGKNLTASVNNPGPKSLPGYRGYFDSAVQGVDGGIKVFAGPTDDPFFVDLGGIFDLVNIDKPGRPSIGFGNQGGGVDSLSRYNVHTIAMQIPIAALKGTSGDVVGAFASTERPTPKTVTIKKGKKKVTKTILEWKQVSRLGNPLINEVVIPRYLKDQWNTSDPSTDAKYEKYYLKPFVAGALNALFPTLNLGIPTDDRKEVSLALLSGADLSGLGLANNSTGTAKADLLRLNLSTPVSAAPKPLGEIQGDPQGFPNGRRLVDDVTDIELRVIGGNLYNLSGPGREAKKLPLGDGVNANDVPFLPAFPYVAPAHDGFNTTGPSHNSQTAAAPAVGPLP
jgi:hypothetical protein